MHQGTPINSKQVSKLLSDSAKFSGFSEVSRSFDEVLRVSLRLSKVLLGELQSLCTVLYGSLWFGNVR